MEDHILIRYGELSLKKTNRRQFIQKVTNNIRRNLKNYPNLEFESRGMRFYIHLHGTDSTSIIEELKKIPVNKICEKDCLLFLWVVSPMLDSCIDVLKSWGFKYSTIGFIWNKERTNPGSYTMSECEICIIGKKRKYSKTKRKKKY